MRWRRLLVRVTFAVVAAVLLGVGVVAGGTAYQAIHPAYDRITWTELDPTDPGGDHVVRRALYADGRFLALTGSGYRAGIVPPALANEVFETAQSTGGNWDPEYRSPSRLGELIRVELHGRSSRSIAIQNPDTNVRVPPSLGRILLILAAADRQVALVPFRPAAMRFWASPMADAGGAAVGDLPAAFPFDQASSAEGEALGGSDLAVLEQVWPEVTAHLGVGVAHRVVRVGAQLWRVSWTLDLDSVGGSS